MNYLQILAEMASHMPEYKTNMKWLEVNGIRTMWSILWKF